MNDGSVSRREVLAKVGVGVSGLVAGTGAAEADSVGRSIVGTNDRSATDAAKRRADSVHRVLDFGGVGQAVAGRFSAEALDALRRNPNVRYVEDDGTMEAIAQTLPWGIDRVDAEKVHVDGETGGDNTDGDGGADVAIVDTGIDSDHPDLQANVGEGEAFVSCQGGDCRYAWDDDEGHGTHCAGIADALDDSDGVVGVSTAATLHAVKVLDGTGSGAYSDVAAGIEWVADQGYDVASISLGGSKSRAVEDACEYAYGEGVLLVAAAGNRGPCSDCVGYPAAEPEVVAVSATDRNDSLADYSSTGSEVEIAAPGSNVYSTYIGGYGTLSGTSMACPHVSGAGGQLMDNGYTNEEARSRLTDTAEDVGLPSNEQGSGLLDVEAAVGGSSDTAPTVDALSVTEVETGDSDAEFDASWEVGDADGDLSTVDLSLADDTDGETEDSASVGVSGSGASDTTRLVAPGDDGSGNSYTVDLTVTDSTGATSSMSASVTETESTDDAPSVRIDSLSDRSNPSWDRYEVDWSAGDPDGDLETVVTEMRDAGGGVLDSVTTDVSGSSASGVSDLRSKRSGATVVVVATDTAGVSESASRSI